MVDQSVVDQSVVDQPVVDQLLAQAECIRNGEHDTIKPGQPFRINEAATVGDRVWQGDLCIKVVPCVPNDYVLTSDPVIQLVPGNTEGAKHRLDALDGVKMFLPGGWGPNYEGLLGPAFVLTQERTIMHPVHGDVTIAAGHTILCSYQREYDAELRRERRNAD